MQIGVHDSIAFSFDPERIAGFLESHGHQCAVLEAGSSVEEYDCVVTFGHEDVLLDAPWVHCIRAGVDAFPFERYAETGTALTNSPGIHATTIGETVLGMLLSFARRLHRYRDRQHANSWEVEPYDATFTVQDETVCVVGLGTLGEGVALRADALGMTVRGVRREPKPVPGVDELFRPDELHDAVAGARFVVLCVPLTEDTEAMIDADVFAAMDDDAYLINVARGGVVAEDALLDALDGNEIAGAGLDAHAEEPLPADSPLWEYDDVIVTPHVGALSNTYHESVGKLVVANAERLENGESLSDRVV
ncbi:D-2-hydroxyacid dehydrogenase [Halocatena salina]|uniref:D-2-hydroxyacid dehydrogenase n=1 Tax=Halocatena salina TaxID=2934340 RepID=A0A8T9ZZS9_9EURY|nr:D-2-hydroxyacid dehydrogenase [Halocatena salina]UPM42295.1 D-2-hydroxyacid dehydrogenase [Halocatena salina]